jgi:disulfide bond formation protein DsbB
MIFLQLYTFQVVKFLSVLTLAGGALAVTLLAILIFQSKTKAARWIEKNALILMFIVALIASCGSLFLSEIGGWVPCKLCWFQRMFMYPQVILLSIALWQRDRKIAPYILALCLVGMVFSSIHYIEQVNAALYPITGNLTSCDTSGVSCVATQINFTFGYITIPMMALTAFILNAISSFFVVRRSWLK